MTVHQHAADPHTDLASSLDQGFTLPARWYTGTDVFEAEQRQIFGASWQFAGLAEKLSRPGDFLTCRAGPVPLVVVRGEDGELRAFANVCRHRGSELIGESAGNRKSLQCRYHAWTYGLDGALRAAPGSKDEPGFDLGSFTLVRASVDQWGPFVFVNPDPTPQPLHDVLRELPHLVDATGLRLDAIRRKHRQEYVIAANWKVVVDNYLECYHCPVAHPGFCHVIDLDQYEVTEYEHFSTQTAPAKQRGRGEGVFGSEVTAGFYAYLWPNFTINIYPGPGNVSLNLFSPIDAGKTRVTYEYCFVDQVSDAEVEEFVGFVDQIQNEDTELCESVQRGLGSGMFDQGRLMLKQESALRHFQKLVYRNVHAAGLEPPAS
ncbi:MAG TPA: aromatic ring-hydroxylating dioxygenase subunit alpha [Chloroflexota bacterium]|jgi:choline monooxygenase|nr:aromatic ring-hydroxylating dioxygenase subunit alpha [Chloroflexota bacterium]